MPDLTLYIAEFSSVKRIECSPPSWMAMLLLEEKELPYQCRALSFSAGEHRTPEMLSRNPRGTIPVLTDGDTAIHETYAILQYIDFAYPKPPFMPSASDDRAMALTKLHEAENLKAAGMKLFAFLMRLQDPEAAREEIQTLNASLRRELAFWERYYSTHTWAAGDAITLADLCVFTYLATAVHLGLQLDPDSDLEKFYDRMCERPSVEKTWPPLWKASSYTFLTDTQPEDNI